MTVARALEPGDLPALSALRLEGIRLFPQAFLLSEAEAQASDAPLRRWIESGTVFGLFDGDRLIGFAGLSRQGNALSAHRASLGPFYVTPDAQGAGAADRLMDHLVATAKDQNATQLELYVAAANLRARAFYTRHGFATSGRLPAAVIQNGTPQDDLLMVRDLTEAIAQPGPDGLRRLGPGDWRMYRAIRLEMLEKEPMGFGMTAAEFAAMQPDEILPWMAKSNIWAVVKDGAILATAAWFTMPGAVQAHRGHVVAVYTTQAARGRGLARKLLAEIAAEAQAQGKMQLELDVGAENTAAIKAYEAAGYRIAATIPNCLNHGGHIHDQHLMIRPLNA
ncbi:GNAT family N-acetyltransferase [Rhodobacteraceae bacterium M385]|nr:GNAT family N-acetyltransferase [Rhodobacteraceae bacterium M385]